MDLPNAKELLFKDIGEVNFEQFIDLLESFDIALRLDDKRSDFRYCSNLFYIDTLWNCCLLVGFYLL